MCAEETQESRRQSPVTVTSKNYNVSIRDIYPIVYAVAQRVSTQKSHAVAELPVNSDGGS